MRRRLLTACVLALGCAPNLPNLGPPVAVCQSYRGADVSLYTATERVYTAGIVGQRPIDCATFNARLAAAGDKYFAQWATVDLRGWLIAGVTNAVEGPYGATTWQGDREILIAVGNEPDLPHEMEHVRLGESSSRHCRWVSDGFAAWENEALQLTEVAYINSTCPENP